MEPVGEVTFDEAPETWIAGNASWADMGIALGQGPPEGLWTPSRYHTHVYDDIPGVSVDRSSIQTLWPGSGLSKEQFLAIGADVHVADPVFVTARSKWTDRDLATIEDRAGPFFGNSIYTRAHPWHDHRYYSLYEAFEKLAAVFDEMERYRAFEELHDSFLERVQSRLPPAKERPSVAIVLAVSEEPEEFYPYPMNAGTSYKQWRDLGATSALRDAGIGDYYASGSTIDYEALLEADPDVLLLWGGTGEFERMSRDAFRGSVVSYLEGHETASQLRAVENGRVYRGNGIFQGPIINLVWTERAAWKLYPGEFEWGEELFDRDIIKSSPR
jgi:iron complex transport system substrate-binding protein